jgi:HK97 family phage prohead protease
MNSAPVTRAAVSESSSAITITGSAVMYGATYSVRDSYGEFEETIEAGALTSALASSDVRFKYDHAGLVLARSSSGTLSLTDTTESLRCRAVLDARQQAAQDLAIAIGRGDVSAMSWAFRVAADGDVWNDAYTRRRITRVSAVYDVSAVGEPASPTTSIELAAIPEHLAPDLRAQADADYAYVMGEIRWATETAQAELAREARVARQRNELRAEMREMKLEDERMRQKYGIPAPKKSRRLGPPT